MWSSIPANNCKQHAHTRNYYDEIYFSIFEFIYWYYRFSFYRVSKSTQLCKNILFKTGFSNNKIKKNLPISEEGGGWRTGSCHPPPLEYSPNDSNIFYDGLFWRIILILKTEAIYFWSIPSIDIYFNIYQSFDE